MNIPDPKFIEPIVGQFKPDNSIYSVLFATDAVLLENELNEMQWINIDRYTNIMREQYTSGFFNKTSCQISGNNVEITNQEGTNNPFSLNISGLYLKIAGSTQHGKIVINTQSLSQATHLFYLEVFFEVIDFQENKIKKMGGLEDINYIMKDVRVGKGTSKRIQLRWEIKSTQNVNNLSSVSKSFPTTPNPTNIEYSPISGDPCFVAHLNQDKKIDETSYAIPLFLVNKESNSTTITSMIQNVRLKRTFDFYVDNSNYQSQVKKITRQIPINTTNTQLTHNLNTEDVVVSVREVGANKGFIFPSIVVNDKDKITIDFGTSTTTNYIVTIIG